MSTERNDGGPAFPAEVGPMGGMAQVGNQQWLTPGMTLRDYFAAKAMQGDIASMASHADPAIAGAYIAERAYAIADAMLKAREA